MRSTATSGPLIGSGGYAPSKAGSDGPESGGVAHRTPGRFLLTAALAVAVVLLVVWAAVYPRTPDLAAAVYRVDLFKRIGLAVWDANWYAGHHLLGYSVLFPPLGAALGVRVLGCAAVLVSVTAFERLVVGSFGPRARAGAALFAVAAVGDVWVGRVTFALGVALALVAYLAFVRRRAAVAAALAALCALASPVAAALLALAGVTHALSTRRGDAALSLALPAAFVVAALALLFPEGGFEPFPIRSFVPTAVVIGAFLVALPRRPRALRLGAVLYLACSLAALLVHTPLGSNVERYGVLLAGPLLLCSLLSARERRGGPRVIGPRGMLGSRPSPGPVGALALVVWAVWCVWGPVRETVAVAGNASTSAAYYAPVKRFFAARGPVRVEVPLTRSHWEAALLADAVSLGRGWEKQLDERYDGPLLSSAITPESYRRWLEREAVGYVALPDTQLDPSSSGEGRLIRGGLPYLREVYAGAHWRIFAVEGAVPIASGPGSLISLAHDSFALRARGAGSFLVRVHFSRYFVVTGGNACVRSAPEGWTDVRARAAGRVEVQARFSPTRALGLGGECH